MTGLGAWSFGTYAAGKTYTAPRNIAGLGAFKREMIYCGTKRLIAPSLPAFGNATENAVKDFQRAWGMDESGIIGPRFARYLFWKRANVEALRTGIPNRLVHRLVTLESGHDPVAQGYADARDEGGAQIHMPFNPDVTVAEAWDPAFYLPFVADRLTDAYKYVGKDWDGAVAAHNCGAETARLWVAAGKPGAGRVVNGLDWFSRATSYVALVKRQPVF